MDGMGRDGFDEWVPPPYRWQLIWAGREINLGLEWPSGERSDLHQVISNPTITSNWDI